MASRKWQLNRPNWQRWFRSLGFSLTLFSLTVVLCLALPNLQRVMAQSIVCSTKQSCLAKSRAALKNNHAYEAKKQLETLQTEPFSSQLTPEEKWEVWQSLGELYGQLGDPERAYGLLQQARAIALTIPEPAKHLSATQYAQAQICVGKYQSQLSAQRSTQVQVADTLKDRFLYLQGTAQPVLPDCADKLKDPLTYGVKQIIRYGIDQFNTSLQPLSPVGQISLTQPASIAIEVLEARLQQLRLLVNDAPQFYGFLTDVYQKLNIDLEKQADIKYDSDQRILSSAKDVQKSNQQFSEDLADLILSLRDVWVSQPNSANDPRWGAAQLHFAESLSRLILLSDSFNQSDSALHDLLKLVNTPPSKLSDKTRKFLAELRKSLPTSILTPNIQATLFGSSAIAYYRSERDQVLQLASNQTDPKIKFQAISSRSDVLEEAKQYGQINQLLTPQTLLEAGQTSPPELSGPLYGKYARALKRQADTLKGPENEPAAIAKYREAKTASDLAITRIESIRGDLVSSPIQAQYTYRNTIDRFYRDNIDLHLTELHQEQSSAQVNPRDVKQEKEFQQHLKFVLNRVEALKLAEIHNYFREPCVAGKSVAIDDFIEQVSQATALIYPIVLSDRIEIIAKLPNQKGWQLVKSIPLKQDVLKATVQDLQAKIKEGNINKPAQKLYDWLISPLDLPLSSTLPSANLTKEQDKGTQTHLLTLVFVLDRALQNVPMAALYDQKNNAYLIQQAAIAITPGLSLFEPKPSTQLNVLFAGLTVKSKNESLKGPGVELRALTDLGVVKQGALNQLANLKESKSGLIETDFTPQNFGSALNLAPFNVVHLSTHAKFNPNPQDTYVQMVGENNGEAQVNINQFRALIQSRDRQREEPIELLVLSACETAKDDQAILGLAGIALQSGARSTFASLWSVEDDSTALVIEKFYTALAKDKKTKAEALQIAQSSLIEANRANPYIWAPYVLVGNWL